MPTLCLLNWLLLSSRSSFSFSFIFSLIWYMKLYCGMFSNSVLSADVSDSIKSELIIKIETFSLSDDAKDWDSVWMSETLWFAVSINSSLHSFVKSLLCQNIVTSCQKISELLVKNQLLSWVMIYSEQFSDKTDLIEWVMYSLSWSLM